MIRQLWVGLFSGLGATVIGCVLTWCLATRAARNQARRERNQSRREALVEAAEALQNYKVAYGQFYVEYLSPGAQAKRGPWAKGIGDKPDETYLKLMADVDKGGGRLRVIHGGLYAHFPQDVISPLCKEIMTVIVLSAGRADCQEIDRIAEGACNLIPDLMRKYL